MKMKWRNIKMKEITSTVYKAFDGKEFTDKGECGQY